MGKKWLFHKTFHVRETLQRISFVTRLNWNWLVVQCWNMYFPFYKAVFHLCFSAMSLDKFEKSPREIFHPEIQKVGGELFFV